MFAGREMMDILPGKGRNVGEKVLGSGESKTGAAQFSIFLGTFPPPMH
jgi:hypothetical protein